MKRDREVVLGAACNVTAAAGAVQTMTERKRAARDSGMAAAQRANAAQLERKMDAAIAEQHTVTKADTADLRSLGLRLSPTKKAATKGRALLVSWLSTGGVTLLPLRPFVDTALG